MTAPAPASRMQRLVSRAVPAAGPVRKVAFSTLLTTMGDGLFVTVSTLFFTRVVGLSLVEVGLGLTIASLAGLLFAIPLGHVADRKGAHRVLLLLTTGVIPAILCYLWVRSFWLFVIVACVVGVLQRGCRTVLPALIADIAAPDDRVSARAHLQVVTNVGISVGAGAAGIALFIDTRTAYQALVVGAALMYVASAAVLTRIPKGPAAADHPQRARMSLVLTDLPFLAFTGLNALLALNSGLMEIALPLWIVMHTDAPAWMFSALIVMNTVLVVLFQLKTSSRGDSLAGAARSSRWAGVFLAATCLLYAAAGSDVGALLAAAILILAMTAHTWGEMHQVSGEWGLSFRLAPAHAHGQYQGMLATGRAATSVAAPILLIAVISAGKLGWLVLAALFVISGLLVPATTRWAERTGKHT
ncbi:MFS transporter [Streptomyces sp. NPDC091272]|uniref:MFS transporter n=1 Tax=Streptomyces sp. NPDC091272 TaxID=3365981 RepID=UPI003805C774